MCLATLEKFDQRKITHFDRKILLSSTVKWFTEKINQFLENIEYTSSSTTKLPK